MQLIDGHAVALFTLILPPSCPPGSKNRGEYVAHTLGAAEEDGGVVDGRTEDAKGVDAGGMEKVGTLEEGEQCGNPCCTLGTTLCIAVCWSPVVAAGATPDVAVGRAISGLTAGDSESLATIQVTEGVLIAVARGVAAGAVNGGARGCRFRDERGLDTLLLLRPCHGLDPPGPPEGATATLAPPSLTPSSPALAFHPLCSSTVFRFLPPPFCLACRLPTSDPPLLFPTSLPQLPLPPVPLPLSLHPPSPIPLAPLSPAPLSLAPLSPVPLSPAPLSPAPLSPAPLSLAPLSLGPLSPAPLSPAPQSPAPLSPAPISPAPL
ncbi:unnamed protein product [Closterium sp. Naga37s-1]|nr:unnamed protein product [Closterium sp. Naga37s-1]